VIIQSSTSSVAESNQNAVATDMINIASPDHEEFMDADATDLTQEAAVVNPMSDLISHDESYA
jgi:hypothetical protein